MKKRKTQKSQRAGYEPLRSPIIQVGIVFFIVAAMVLVAYAVKFYTP